MDQRSDLTQQRLYKYAQTIDLPDFVKQASENALFGPEDMAPQLFANPGKKEYPCHTKAATWLSALYFSDSRDEYTEEQAAQIEANLRKFAQYFQIETVLDQLTEKAAAVKQAAEEQLSDDDFALVFKTANETIRKYPLRNPDEVAAASDWFAKYRDELSFHDRSAVASKILKKAATFGVELVNADMLEKTAGFGYNPADDVAYQWELRAALVRQKNAELAEMLTKTAAICRANPDELLDREVRLKMASQMSDVDTVCGLKQHYDTDILRPEDALFQLSEKTAKRVQNEYVFLQNGSVYEKQALASVPNRIIREHLGDQVADNVRGVMDETDEEELAKVASSMPAEGARRFDLMAKAAGIRRSELSSTQSKYVPTEALNAWAGVYLQARN